MLWPEKGHLNEKDHDKKDEGTVTFLSLPSYTSEKVEKALLSERYTVN